MRRLLAFFLLTISVLGNDLFSQTIPEPMHPPRLVNDFANIFSDTEKQALEQMLRAYNDSTSTQIYVVTISDLQGYPASEFAYKVGDTWGIGQKGKDNGAVLLIKPRTRNERGDIFIATGYGLEERLTDARCGRIIDERILPFFRQDDYYGGVDAGVRAMMLYLSGAFKTEEAPDESLNESTDTSAIFLGVILAIVIILIVSKLGGGGGSSHGGSSGRPIFRGGFPTGRRMGGGGTFSGGGGGRFGGGGAGRSW